MRLFSLALVVAAVALAWSPISRTDSIKPAVSIAQDTVLVGVRALWDPYPDTILARYDSMAYHLTMTQAWDGLLGLDTVVAHPDTIVAWSEGLPDSLYSAAVSGIGYKFGEAHEGPQSDPLSFRFPADLLLPGKVDSLRIEIFLRISS